MEWYRFEKDNPIGIPRVKEYQANFYEENGDCFDEAWFGSNELGEAIVYAREDIETTPYSKLFAIFDDNTVYEIVISKVSNEIIS